MNNLAMAYRDAGRTGPRIPLHEQTLKVRRAKLGEDHPNTLVSMGNLALAYREAGQLDPPSRSWSRPSTHFGSNWARTIPIRFGR